MLAVLVTQASEDVAGHVMPYYTAACSISSRKKGASLSICSSKIVTKHDYSRCRTTVIHQTVATIHTSAVIFATF